MLPIEESCADRLIALARDRFDVELRDIEIQVLFTRVATKTHPIGQHQSRTASLSCNRSVEWTLALAT
jgi:hypothetical protein